MGLAKTSLGRGCCLPSKKQSRMSKLASFGFILTEILVLGTLLILSQVDDMVKVDKPFQIISIIIICVHVLIQTWELKIFLRPDPEEKFSLTIQGSHVRKTSRHRRTMYGVAYSEEVRVAYDRNPDGILVYFRKVISSSNTSPYCQPSSLPIRGWFTFFHCIIALTLLICVIGTFITFRDNYSYYYYNSYYHPLGRIPFLLPVLFLVSLILHTPVLLSSYYTADDCGFCIPIFNVGYTRWFKHMNAYTNMIQQNILVKNGQKLQQEGDQLEIAVRKNMQKIEGSDGVTYHNVGPQTAKRYQDQVVLLHLLLAQEHDKVCKNVFPEYNIENKGVSFTLTAKEIETLEMFAEKANERVDDANDNVHIDINEMNTTNNTETI